MAAKELESVFQQLRRQAAAGDARRAHFDGFNGITEVVARARGMGIFARMLKEPPTQPIRILLPPEIQIHGRLLTLEGAPAQGVRVEFQGLVFHRPGAAGQDDNREWAYVSEGGKPLVPGWPGPVLTDAEGRFSLPGLSKDVHARLCVSHPGFAEEYLGIFTDEKERSRQRSRASADIAALGPEFTHALEPGRVVRGVVTARDTGKPVEGAVVDLVAMGANHMGRARPTTKTDRDGRYRFDEVPARATGTYHLTVVPPAMSGYLTDAATVRGWPKGAPSLEENFSIASGRIVRGTVRDADMGQPIRGAIVAVLRGGKNSVLSDDSGSFAISCPSGQQWLAVSIPGNSYVRPALSLEEARQYMSAFHDAMLPHGLIKIPASGDGAPLAFAVRRGIDLEARVVRPDGQPATGIRYICPAVGINRHEMNVKERLAPGHLRLHGCDSRRAYRVFILQADRHLAAVADLKHDPNNAGAIEIKLQPTSAVRGKIVRGGVPATKDVAEVIPLLWLRDDPLTYKSGYVEPFAGYPFFFHLEMEPKWDLAPIRPDSQGNFHFTNLLPGAPILIWGRTFGGEDWYAGSQVVLEPGEVRDLGTLTLEKSR